MRFSEDPKACAVLWTPAHASVFSAYAGPACNGRFWALCQISSIEACGSVSRNLPRAGIPSSTKISSSGMVFWVAFASHRDLACRQWLEKTNSIGLDFVQLLGFYPMHQKFWLVSRPPSGLMRAGP